MANNPVALAAVPILPLGGAGCVRAPPGAVSTAAMTQAMLRVDDIVAGRVAAFEVQFGPTNDRWLGVPARAACLCWGNCEYRGGLAPDGQRLSVQRRPLREAARSRSNQPTRA